ncbi:MAG: hypothetical protein R3C03_23005 [Pirellulaceae bacterium]
MAATSRLVNETMLTVARRQESVLDYPEPSAVLVKIGSRSLDYELRLYLPSRSSFSKLQNNLNIELIEALEAAGIDVFIPSEGPMITERSRQTPALYPQRRLGNELG